MAQINTSPLSWEEAEKVLSLLEEQERWHHLILLAIGFYTGCKLDDVRYVRYNDFSTITMLVKNPNRAENSPMFFINHQFNRIINLCKRKTSSKSKQYVVTRTRVVVDKPMSKPAVINRLKEAFVFCGYESEHVGFHTLRKTYALHRYQLETYRKEEKYVLRGLRKTLRQANNKVTRRYIGI